MPNKKTKKNRKPMEYSDQKRKGLFRGTALDYVRMRADKHEKIYHDKKQAKHLRILANEIDRIPIELNKKILELNIRIMRLERELVFYKKVLDISL